MKQTLRTTLIFISCAALFSACSTQEKKPGATDTTKEEKNISVMLDSFNKAAARADFNAYFNFYTEDAIFTGTDATERWGKAAFMEWAKPIFQKGRAWDFTALERHIYFDETGNLAWFDELLNTQMKICRGSGVVVKQAGEWKVKQYILSTTIPNDLLDSVIKIKSVLEDSLVNAIQKKK